MKADRPIRSGAESLFSVLRLYDASVDCWGVTDMIWNTRGKHLPRSNLGVARCWRESATDSPGQRVDGSRRAFSSYNFRVNWIHWKKWKFLTWSVINTLTGSYYSELAQPPWLAGFLAQVCCFRPLESTLLWDLKTVTQEKNFFECHFGPTLTNLCRIRFGTLGLGAYLCFLHCMAPPFMLLADEAVVPQ